MGETEHTRAAARRALFELYRERGDCVWVEATGSSMLPFIRDGFWLLVDFGLREARLGEIAVFPCGDRIVGHRVVRGSQSHGVGVLATKGDARLEFDPPVPAGELLGVVRGLRRTRDGATAAGACRGPGALSLALISAGIGHAANAAGPRARRLLRGGARQAHAVALGVSSIVRRTE